MSESNLALLELERTEIHRLFDKREMNYLYRQRQQYESGNIRKILTGKTHRLRYIGLEMEILKLVSFRIHLLKDKTLKLEMQRGIVERIASLFKLVTCHFRNDHRPWLWYVNCCKKLKLRDSVNQMIEALVCMHGDKPRTWKLAARWEFEENGSVHTARQFLLRGLRFLPYSGVLYKEAFRLELEFADQLRKKLKEVECSKSDSLELSISDEWEKKEKKMDISLDIPEKQSRLIASGGLAEVVYEVASAKIPEVEFISELLNIARSYNFTAELRLKIVRNLCSRFPDEARTWDAIARSELYGLRCFPEKLIDESFPENDPRNSRLHTRTLKERLLRCVAAYSYAVRTLRTKEMWSLYLERLIKLNRNEFSSTRFPKLKEKLLFKGFVEAHSIGLVADKYYLYWVRFAAAGRRRKLGYVLRVASEKLPLNVGLWQMRLGYFLSKGDEQEAISVFRNALNNMAKETDSLLCLWNSVLEHGLTNENPIVEKLFQEGLKPNSPLEWYLKPMYLEWLATTNNIDAARAEYEIMRTEESSINIRIHYTMAELELAQIPTDLERIRQCYEQACEQSGSVDPDAWVQYAKLEMMSGDLERTCEIQRRALEALSPRDSDEFIRKYTYLRNCIPAS